MSHRIIIIDDELDMTDLVASYLALNGFQTKVFNDPVLGLAAVKGEPCDALVVDLMMPGLTGMALIEALRDHQGGSRLPVFALSAKNLTPEERKRLLTLGVHFVQKPFSPRRFTELLRQHLPA